MDRVRSSISIGSWSVFFRNSIPVSAAFVCNARDAQWVRLSRERSAWRRMTIGNSLVTRTVAERPRRCQDIDSELRELAAGSIYPNEAPFFAEMSDRWSRRRLDDSITKGASHGISQLQLIRQITLEQGPSNSHIFKV